VTLSLGDLTATVDRLRAARRSLLTCHMRPDGDAIGSELALAELAESLGTAVAIVNRDPAPAPFAHLPGIERVVVAETLPQGFPEEFDLVVALECPSLDRAGLDGLDCLPILNIDHHRANDLYGEVNLVDPEAPAVGEMVWKMYREAGVKPSRDTATNAYVALATDTGDFRYSNATERAFAAAAEMVAAGARPEQVSQWVHQSRSEASVRLTGEALATLELECRHRLATLVVDPEAFRRAGATPADTEGLLDLPRSIAGVEAVALLKEWEPGTVRVSLRSTGDVDVRRVAASLGGGGHTNAAGCTLHGDLPAARRRIVELLTDLLEVGE